MLNLIVNPRDPMPLYAQIVSQFRLAILGGEMDVGDRLPTVRQLAVDLRINSNTVARAYSELHLAGYIETRQGVGTFVKGNTRPPPLERERQLETVARTAAAEAAALGFGPDELVVAIQKQSNGGEPCRT